MRCRLAKIQNVLLLVTCSFLLGTACKDLLHPPGHVSDSPLSAGTGLLSLTFADSSSPGRTIMPKFEEDTFKRYRLEFTRSTDGTSVPTVWGTKEELERGVKLEAGWYTLKVYAYTNEDVNQDNPMNHSAYYYRSTPFEIEPNSTKTIGNIQLTAVSLTAVEDKGNGTFSWNIGYDPGSNLTLQIFPAGSDVAARTSSAASGSFELDTGVYSVIITLKQAHRREIAWRETLHVYRNMNSHYQKTFDDNFFLKEIYTVRVRENNGNAEGVFSHLYGDTDYVPSGTGPNRTGYNFKGWCEQHENCLEAHTYPSSPVPPLTGDLTLYAKWNLRVTLATVTPNGHLRKVTNALDLTFTLDEGVTAPLDLSGSDVTLGGATRSGALSGSGNTYTQGIIPVTSSGNVTVQVHKAGYDITPASDTAYVHQVTRVIFDSVGHNGAGQTPSSELTLNFSVAIAGLNADDITLSGIDGVRKRSVTGSGPSYTLPIINTTGNGSLNVKVGKDGFEIVTDTRSTGSLVFISGRRLDNVTSNNQKTENKTSEIRLFFNSSIPGLTSSDIHFVDISPQRPNELFELLENIEILDVSGGNDNRDWVLELNVGSFDYGAVLKVVVEKSGYEPMEREGTISDDRQTMSGAILWVPAYIRFDLNGGEIGTGIPPDRFENRGLGGIVLPDRPGPRLGYTFAGWNPDRGKEYEGRVGFSHADATGAFGPNEFFAPSKFDNTLYAHWINPMLYKIVYMYIPRGTRPNTSITFHVHIGGGEGGGTAEIRRIFINTERHATNGAPRDVINFARSGDYNDYYRGNNDTVMVDGDHPFTLTNRVEGAGDETNGKLVLSRMSSHNWFGYIRSNLASVTPGEYVWWGFEVNRHVKMGGARFKVLFNGEDNEVGDVYFRDHAKEMVMLDGKGVNVDQRVFFLGQFADADGTGIRYSLPRSIPPGTSVSSRNAVNGLTLGGGIQVGGNNGGVTIHDNCCLEHLDRSNAFIQFNNVDGGSSDGQKIFVLEYATERNQITPSFTVSDSSGNGSETYNLPCPSTGNWHTNFDRVYTTIYMRPGTNNRIILNGGENIAINVRSIEIRNPYP